MVVFYGICKKQRLPALGRESRIWGCGNLLGGVAESRLAFAFALFLLAEHGLLLFLHLFEACHEAGFLFRFLGVGGHGFAHAVFLDGQAECVGLADGDQQRQEVVIAKAGRVVVEENHEEDRHEVHHPLHPRHTGGLLVLHIKVGVDDVCGGHQQAEQRDVVAEVFGHERDVAAPGDDGVGSREVMHPEEVLSAEFDAGGEELEDGEEYRHL